MRMRTGQCAGATERDQLRLSLSLFFLWIITKIVFQISVVRYIDNTAYARGKERERVRESYAHIVAAYERARSLNSTGIFYRAM